MLLLNNSHLGLGNRIATNHQVSRKQVLDLSRELQLQHSDFLHRVESRYVFTVAVRDILNVTVQS